LQGGKSLLGTIPIDKQKSLVVVHPSASEIDMLQLATYPQIRHVRKTLQLEKWSRPSNTSTKWTLQFIGARHSLHTFAQNFLSIFTCSFTMMELNFVSCIFWCTYSIICVHMLSLIHKCNTKHQGLNQI
jgi:hypothetical protein